MSLNQEVFLHNLEAARRKAGSVANLMGALDGTNMTYYGWKKKIPKNIGSKLVTNLANYLGTTPEKLFTDKLNMPQDLREETPGLSLSKFLMMEVDYESPKRPATQWIDPYLKQIVLLFLQKAESEEEWNKFCDIIKEMYGDTYPSWWGQEVLFSGLLKEISQKWQKGKKKPKWNNLFEEEDNV